MARRRPFDPSRIRKPADAVPADSGRTTLSVRQVNELVRGVLAAHVPATLHVVGEISRPTRAASGHLYFTLKDEHSELRCILWRSSAAGLKFEPENGLEVVASGQLEVYTPRGTYQLIARKLAPRGVGALEIAFRQLKARLEAEGLFADDRKRPLPTIPERVAVVTSPTGAAVRDILHTLRRRFPGLHVLLFPVRVQGDGAAAEIATTIKQLNRHAAALGGIDVAIVGRGGGSLEDLWAFNEEVVARAIAASRVPIVSAVGHEVDVTISDLVADLRAPTPTAAAELITPTVSELLERLDTWTARVGRLAAHGVQLGRAELNTLLAAEWLARPLARLRERAQLVDEMQQSLRHVASGLLHAARLRVGAAEQALLRFRAGARFVQAQRDIERIEHRLATAWQQRRHDGQRRVAHVLARLEGVHPRRELRRQAERLRRLPGRLAVAARVMLTHRRRLLEARWQVVKACDPRGVLRRGYSITRHAQTHKIIRSIDEIRDKGRIITEVADGSFRATTDDPRQPELFDE